MASILNVDKIRRQAGSTDALVIDSSDRITTPTRPAFSCRPNGSISISASGWKTVDFETVDFDIGSNLNAAGYFVCPVTGVYQFNYHMRLDSVGSGIIILALGSETSGTATPTTDGNQYYNSYVINGSPNSTYDSLATSLTIQLSAGTNVVPWHYSADSSYTISPASNFSGFFVG